MLLAELQKLRLGVIVVNRVRAFLTVATLLMALSAVGVVTHAIYAHVVHPDQPPPWTCAPLMLAMIGGLFGGYFSLMSRLFAVPCKGDLVDRQQSTAGRLLWIATPFVALAEGVIAAMVLFFLFQARLGILNGFGKVVPDLSTTSPGVSPAFFMDFPPVELGKLLVWSFIAGFSERLIPDMLRQLSDRATARGANSGN